MADAPGGDRVYRVIYQVISDWRKWFADQEKAQQKIKETQKAETKESQTAVQANREAEASTSKRNDTLKGFIKSLQEQEKATKKLQEADQGRSRTSQLQARIEEKLASSRERVAAASLQAMRATYQLEKAQKRFNDTMNTTDVDKRRQAILGLKSAHLDLQRSVRGVSVATQELNDKQRELRGGGWGNFFREVVGGFGSIAAAAEDVAVIMEIFKLPVMVVGLRVILAAVQALAAGFISLAGAIGPAVGALATIPQAFVGLGTVIGTFTAGLSGIGEALKALDAQQKASATNAKAAADAQAAAADQVRAAQQSLADARRTLADTYESSAESIEAAEEGVRDAQESARIAQEALTQAREDAKIALSELRDEVEGLRLSEERASLSLREARQRYLEVLRDPNATRLEIQSAALAVREAEYSLKEARENAKRAAKELREEERKGINQSDEVVAAREAQRDAAENLSDAQKNLAQTQEDASESIKDAQRGVKDASQALKDALEAQTEATAGLSAEDEKLKEAFASLTPEARKFVRQLYAMKPLLDELRASAQRGLLPGLGEALHNLTSLAPLVNKALSRMGEVLGELAVRGSEMITSGPWKESFRKILESNLTITEQVGGAFLDVADAIRIVAEEAIPLAEWFGELTESFGNYIQKSAMVNQKTGDMRRFFEKTEETLSVLGNIFKNLIETFINIGSAGREMGMSLLEDFEHLTAGWAKWTSTVEGKNAIKHWFEETKPLFDEIMLLIRDLGVALFHLGEDSSMVEFVHVLRVELLPALVHFAETASGQLATALARLATLFLELFETFHYAEDQLFLAIDVMGQFLKLVTEMIAIVPGGTKILGLFFTAFAALKTIQLIGAVTGIRNLVRATGRMGEAVGSTGTLSKYGDGVRAIGIQARETGGKVATAFSNMNKKTVALKGAAAVAATGFVLFGDKLSQTNKAAKVFSDTMTGALIGFSLGGGLGAAIGGAVGLLGGLADAFFGQESATESADQAVGRYIDTLKEMSGQVTQSTRDLAAQRLEHEGLLQVAEEAGIETSRLVDAIVKGGPAYDNLIADLEREQRSRQATIDRLGEEQVARDQMNADNSIYRDGTYQNVRANEDEIDSLGKLTDGLKGERDALIEDQQELRRTSEAADRHADSQDDTANAITRAAEAAERQRDALRAAKEAMLDYNNPLSNARDANRELEASIDDANQALKENGKTLNTHTEKGRENAEALDRMAEAMRGVLGNLRSKSPEVFRERLKKMHDQLVEQAIDFGLNRKRAEAYADEMLRIPAKLKTELFFNAREALSKVKNFSKWYDNLPKYKQLKVQVYFDRRDAATRMKIAANAEAFHASGGYISGPGTGTSDSIPARLSDGEYVVNAKATSANLGLLERINKGRGKRFARGGLVQRFQGGGMAGGWLSFFGLTANLEPLESVAKAAGRRFSQALSSVKMPSFLAAPLRKEIRQANQEMRHFKPERAFSEPMKKAINEVKKAFRNFKIKEWFAAPLKDAVREVAKYLRNVIENFRDNVREIKKSLGTFKPADWIEKALDNMVRDTDRAMDKMTTSFEKGTEKSEKEFEQFENNLDRTWDRIERTFDTSTQRILSGMTRFATGLGNQWTKVQNQMGRPVMFVVNRIINAGLIGHLNKILKQLNVKAINPSGELHFARGGRVPGTGDQDSVRARLMPGEFVLRKKIVKEIGEPALNAINEGQATDWKRRRYREGGRVAPVPGAPGSGTTYEGHDGADFAAPYGTPIRAAAAGVTSYKGWGRGYGLAVFERGPYGELVYGHMARTSTKRGERLKAGEVIGYVDDTGNSSGNHLHFGFPGGTFSQAIAFLKGAKITGAAGAGFPMIDYAGNLQEKLKKLRANMQQRIAGSPLARLPGAAGRLAMKSAVDFVRAKQAAMGWFGVPNLAGVGGPARKIVQQIASQWGWGKGAQWAALAQLVMHESSFRPWAQNPTSSAYGLFQFLDSTWSTVGGHKTSDPRLQTVYGLRYVKSRYGSPIGAWNFWQAHNWYNRGGKQGQDTVPAMLTPGEFVFNKQAVQRIGLKKLEKLNKGQTVKTQGHGVQQFHEGGPVLGLKPGARGKSVKALEAQEFWPVNGSWDVGLSRKLRDGLDPWPRRIALAGQFKGIRNRKWVDRLIRYLKGKKVKVTEQHFRGARSFRDVASRFGGREQVGRVYLTNKSYFDGLSDDKASRFRSGVRDFLKDHPKLKPFKNLGTEVGKGGRSVREISRAIRDFLRKARTSNVPRSVKGGGTIWQAAKKLNVAETFLHFLWMAGHKEIRRDLPGDKRGGFAKSDADFIKDYHSNMKFLQKKLGIKPASGTYTKAQAKPFAHMLAHAFKRKHDRFAPRPWKPLSALDKAIRDQGKANKKQAEFNDALDVIAGWGLTDLLNWLIEQGVDGAYKLAIDASKNRKKATELNEKIKRGNMLTADQVFEISRFIAAIATHPKAQPGLRDMANALQQPDWSVFQLYQAGRARIRKAVGASRLTKLESDIGAFSQGIFYANRGGFVGGRGGRDTIPAMLSPGEFVLRKDAVKRIGLENLFRINDPQKFAMGGLVGKDKVGPNGASYNKVININTTINNPVGENSVASFNRNLRTKAAMGAFTGGSQN